MKKILYISFLLLSLNGYSQNFSDINMLLHPDTYNLIINGLGATNFIEKNILNNKYSSKINVDYVLQLKEISKKRIPLLNISGQFDFSRINKYNPNDTFNLENLYFTNNQNAFNFEIKYYSTKKIGLSKGDAPENYDFYSTFLNFSYSKFLVNSQIPQNNSFEKMQINLGAHGGVLLTTDFAKIMFDLSVYGTFFHINPNDNTDKSFEELVRSQNYPISHDYFGYGGKFTMQLNMLTFYFNIKYYNKIGSLPTPVNFMPLAVSLGTCISASVLEVNTKKTDNNDN